MLRGSSRLAGAAATFLLVEGSRANHKHPQPDRRLRVVVVGGHPDDPGSCAGGTLALYADRGHDVVGLTLTGGPPPAPDANPEVRSVKARLDSIRIAEILRTRLDCLNYMEAELGTQTQNFYPTHHVDITSVKERTHQAWLADTLVYPDVWPLHNLMRQTRGAEHGCKVAEAFNHHPQSPSTPALPA